MTEPKKTDAKTETPTPESLKERTQKLRVRSGLRAGKDRMIGSIARGLGFTQ